VDKGIGRDDGVWEGGCQKVKQRNVRHEDVGAKW
jgi:hypothetical protein